MDNLTLHYEDCDDGDVRLPSFSRAISSGAVDDVITDRSYSYSRSFSHPPERPYVPLDVNRAIHDEIMSSPWGSMGRRNRRRNRYAVYFPEDGPFESLGQFYDNECFQSKRNLEQYTQSPYEYSGNIYATYRRAPRSYPSLDIVHNDIHQSSTLVNSRDITDTRCNQFLPKLANHEVNTTERNVNAGHNAGHTQNEQTASVQHLFSIKLNDVKRVNTMENVKSESKLAECGKIKTRFLNFVSKKCKRRKSCETMKKEESTQTSDKKPFFYCRWVTEYPKTLFCT